MCLLATDNEAIAETVSASSVSRWRASLKEQPSVEAERCNERQYLPAKDQDMVTPRMITTAGPKTGEIWFDVCLFVCTGCSIQKNP